MSGTAHASVRLKRSAIVLASGALLGLVFWLVGSGNHSVPDRAAAPITQDAKAHPRAVVSVVSATPREVPPRAPAPQRTDAAAASAPTFPYAFLGKVTENDATTILLYGAGRTLKVRGPGPLDEQYQVDEVYDDHLVIRYLPLGTRQVLELASRQYAIPGSLRGDYPQD
jgi:hypothetical protein